MGLIGYMRVSTDEQDTALQLDALVRAGVNEADIYRDVISGKTVTRTGLDTALSRLRKGDTMVVWKLDRLGRRARHLHNLIGDLEERGIGFRSLMESFDTTTTMGRAMFGMLCVFAEMERGVISDRTKAGLKAAKARGAQVGRKPAVVYNADEIRRMRQSMTCREVTAKTGVSKSTVARLSHNREIAHERG